MPFLLLHGGNLALHQFPRKAVIIPFPELAHQPRLLPVECRQAPLRCRPIRDECRVWAFRSLPRQLGHDDGRILQHRSHLVPDPSFDRVRGHTLPATWAARGLSGRTSIGPPPTPFRAGPHRASTDGTDHAPTQEVWPRLITPILTLIARESSLHRLPHRRRDNRRCGPVRERNPLAGGPQMTGVGIAPSN